MIKINKNKMDTNSTQSFPKITQIINDSVIYYRDNFKIIFSIMLVPLLIGVSQTLTTSPSFETGIESVSSFISFLISILSLLISIILPVVFYKSISDIENNNFSLNESYKYAFKKLPSIVLISLIMALVVMGASAPLIIPGIILGIYLMLAQVILVKEEKKGYQALIASYNYIKGNALNVFLVSLVTSILFLGIILIINIPQIILVYLSVSQNYVEILFGVINQCVTALLSPIYFILIYKIYSVLKSIKFEVVPEEKLKKHKKVFVALTVYGVIVSILMMIILPIIVIQSLKYSRDNKAQLQENMKLERGI